MSSKIDWFEIKWDNKNMKRKKLLCTKHDELLVALIQLYYCFHTTILLRSIRMNLDLIFPEILFYFLFTFRYFQAQENKENSQKKNENRLFMKKKLPRLRIISQEETFLAWFTRVQVWFIANQTLIQYLQSFYYTRVNLGDNGSKLEPIEIKLWFKLIKHRIWFLSWYNEILRIEVVDV